MVGSENRINHNKSKKVSRCGGDTAQGEGDDDVEVICHFRRTRIYQKGYQKPIPHSQRIPIVKTQGPVEHKVFDEGDADDKHEEEENGLDENKDEDEQEEEEDEQEEEEDEQEEEEDEQEEEEDEQEEEEDEQEEEEDEQEEEEDEQEEEEDEQEEEEDKQEEEEDKQEEEEDEQEEEENEWVVDVEKEEENELEMGIRKEREVLQEIVKKLEEVMETPAFVTKDEVEVVEQQNRGLEAIIMKAEEQTKKLKKQIKKTKQAIWNARDVMYEAGERNRAKIDEEDEEYGDITFNGVGGWKIGDWPKSIPEEEEEDLELEVMQRNRDLFEPFRRRNKINTFPPYAYWEEMDKKREIQEREYQELREMEKEKEKEKKEKKEKKDLKRRRESFDQQFKRFRRN